MATKVTKASPEATPAPGHSAGPAPAGIQGRRYLLLLDMNGTVCYRSEEPVPGVRPDLYVRRKFFYRRGGVGAFVSRLVGSGSFDVCVYTSMMAHNVVAGLDAILPNYRRLLLRVLDRKMTKPDPEGENEWDTVRDMEKVWKELPGFGPSATLLLDNEARKFKDCPRNGIVVPEFGPAEVVGRSSHTLDGLLQYLLQMGEASPADVRQYIESNPYDPDSRLAPAGPGQATSEGPSEEGLVLGAATLDLLMRGLSVSTPALAAAPPPRRGEARGAGAVPRGTSLHLVSLSAGRFLMSSTFDGGRRLEVRGPVGMLSLEKKMDFHRLLQLAADAGAALDVKMDDEEYLP